VTAVSGKRTRIKPLANDFGQGLKIGAVTAPTKGGRVTLASDGVTLIYLSAPGVNVMLVISRACRVRQGLQVLFSGFSLRS
jgi:hypothetical protein